MKTIKSVIVIFLSVILIAAACLPAFAVTIYQYNGYSYQMLANKNIALCGWDNRSPELVVPEYLEDSIFTEVSNFGLTGNNDITTLDLSGANQLQTIGIMAFKDCKGISNVVEIPESVSVVGNGAFQGCSSMTGVVYKADLDTIYAQTFYDCSSLSSVVLPENLKTIEKFAFGNCTSLERLDIPQSVTDINPTAFYNDTNLVLGVYMDSYALQYAEENEIDHIVLDGAKNGDVNGDGVVDILDATEIQKYAAEKIDFTPEQFELGDINDDGYCNVIDALLVQKSVIGAYEIPPIVVRY